MNSTTNPQVVNPLESLKLSQEITTVSVVYHSGTGHTEKMAEAVLAGAASVDGVKTHMIAIEGKDIVDGWN
ncbi:MAG: hypothetical protein AAGI69_19020 [Cyanobacteria bacterium P01_H01_bin.21]